MNDFQTTYQLSRGRFDAEVFPLSQEQLNWRSHPSSLTAGEMALHLAGVEIWFSSQILKTELNPSETLLTRCATEGVVNELPFPFGAAEITAKFVQNSLNTARDFATRLFDADSPEIRTVELQSALGPIITAEGAMARFSFHPAYHHGQVYLLMTAPDFPLA